MKFLKNILVGALCIASLSACDKWLDVNTDPENPSSESATYYTRLAHIEFYTNSAQQFANWRSNFVCGDWTGASGRGTYAAMSYWALSSSPATTPYQWWFVGAANNISYMYDKAMEAGATDFAGVARIIWAYGNMMMTDLYGEMPFSEACGPDETPSYDTGKEIFLGCLESLEEGIALLEKGQDPSLPSLALNDYWMRGDTQKWIKFANLLKARWLVKLSKKSAGKYTDGKYDADAILAALAKGPQSINDDAWINHTDENSTTHDVLGWDEPVDYSPLYSVCGMNWGYMVSEMLVNNLTDFAGSGVEDPRARLIIPWQVSERSADTPEGIVFDGKWRRSLGVDLTSGNSPWFTGGVLRTVWKDGKWGYNATPGEGHMSDTLYVESTSASKGYAGYPSLIMTRGGAGVAESGISGSFYTRVSSPTYLGTYAEACFIKAEVLFNKGDKNGAFEAYKAGVKASMERMNVAIDAWVSGDNNLAECPSFKRIESDEINNFLANGLGNAGNLTLGKIMTQKRLALHFSVEIWNDMRRYDYNPEIFLGFKEPAYHAIDVTAQKTIPNGKQPRRWIQCSHEQNYNVENLKAIGAKVPGANMSDDTKCWNAYDDVYTIKVWWDSTETEWPDNYGA